MLQHNYDYVASVHIPRNHLKLTVQYESFGRFLCSLDLQAVHTMYINTNWYWYKKYRLYRYEDYKTKSEHSSRRNCYEL